MSAYPLLDAALEQLGDSTSRSKQTLYYCDVDFMRASRRTLRQDMKASVYVLLGAAIERFVVQLINGVIEEINAQQVTYRDLSYCLMAISSGGPLSSLQDVRGLKMWDRRVEAISLADSTRNAELSTEHVPLDGRTIRPAHFTTIWNVFGFRGPSLPDPRTGLALQTVAENRNKVAHGQDDVEVVAGMLAIDDMVRLLDQVDGLAVHVYDAAVDYLDGGLYLR